MKSFKQISEVYADNYIGKENKDMIIDLLKNALKEELNAWYGYTITKEFLSGGVNREKVEDFYEEAAEDELKDHAYWLMKRINELGGSIEDISNTPASWLQAEHTYRAPIWKNDENMGVCICSSLLTNIENEKDAIQTYLKLVKATDHIDYTTNRKCKEILADEEEHLQELLDLLSDIESQKCYNSDISINIPDPFDGIDL